MSEPYYVDDSVTLWHGDCVEVLRELPDDSVDSVVTDPPYGLGFMGKAWDSGKSFVERTPAKGNTFDHVGGNHNPSNSADSARTRRSESVKFGRWCELWATDCLRVLKPGGHLLAFGGTRTSHRLACAIEDAGFEIRDSIAWLYGSGFPKSLDVSKAIDKAAGVSREDKFGGMIGRNIGPTGNGKCPDCNRWMVSSNPCRCPRPQDEPQTDAAQQWQGWGTALKPAHEPVVVARKPLVGTVATNVLAHGTGALNIGASRIEHASAADLATSLAKNPGRTDTVTSGVYGAGRPQQSVDTAGRWPANVILDESQAVVLDAQSGPGQSRIGKPRGAASGDGWGMTATGAEYDDQGGASRFFYVAKADQNERPRADGGVAHPTVKPLALMQWLVTLVTPPGGTVLEPFAGSGTTAEACVIEGFKCIAIERETTYLPLIVARLTKPIQVGLNFGESA